MIERIESWYRICADFAADHCFLSGIAAGILAVWLLTFIFWLFRPRRLKKIAIDFPGGTVTVSANAVSGVIRALDVPGLEVFRIGRVSVYNGKKNTKRVRIWADFLFDKTSNLTSATALLQTQAKTALAETLGIRNVAKVEVMIRKTVRNTDSGTASAPSTPAAEPETEKE